VWILDLGNECRQSKRRVNRLRKEADDGRQSKRRVNRLRKGRKRWQGKDDGKVVQGMG